ncbi:MULTISPECIES: helix-turn-helix domain-containing protein [Pseudomonas]|uniref:Helix-turn-helix transcriptional regulator n=1 Tax=Pseudomonas putida TaxID=303 RepID=A0AAP9N047_PSEPU|nr:MULTISPECIES: helix-turn-helix transcriptional regulator [Pseudomonas]MCE0879778.1 helix-turn-helix domain-containing protein [Pseudomonas putida]MDF3873092.1 helix-turn-helix transcriptional regulator [Pseudomonas putida]MDF3879387.1 helix-turn-helix transcriptional regulator [Pseudomonas putida]MDH4843643.1 XRE family transcriptional regulator [Pseudomonas sp. BN605]MDH4857190.1 XRE family transcriptional regulator [Pseudomonas sp. BN505]
MTLKSSFANVLRVLRSQRNITQRGFADTTSRTYLSKLETGRSSLTLDKLEQLSERLEVSPLTLVALTLSEDTGQTANELLVRTRNEIRALESHGRIPGLQATLGDDLAATPSLTSSRNPRTKTAPRAEGALQAELSFSE